MAGGAIVHVHRLPASQVLAAKHLQFARHRTVSQLVQLLDSRKIRGAGGRKRDIRDELVFFAEHALALSGGPVDAEYFRRPIERVTELNHAQTKPGKRKPHARHVSEK